MTRLIVYNIEYCKGNSGLWWQYLKLWKDFFPPKNLDQRIIEHVKALNPDIVALVEIDGGSFRSRNHDEAIFFKNGLNMQNSVEGGIYPLKGWPRLLHYIPILNKHENAIIAKKKLSDLKYHILHEGAKRVVIESTIYLPKKVTLLLAHLSLGKKARAKQIGELIQLVNGIRNPVILMGDFNTFNGEGEIQKLLDETHLDYKFKMDKESQTFTQPTFHPKRRLDYILTSKQIGVKAYKVLNFHFSDHLPLLIDFKVK